MVFGKGDHALILAEDGMDIVVDHVCFGDVREEIVVGLTSVLQSSEFLYDDLVE